MSVAPLPIDSDALRRAYLEEKLSIRTISRALGHSPSTIYRHLRAAEIPVRSKQESQWLVYERCEREYPAADPTAMLRYWRDHPAAARRRRRKATRQSTALRVFNGRMEVTCAHCGLVFRRRRCDVRDAKRRGRRICCSSSCRARLIPRRRP